MVSKLIVGIFAMLCIASIGHIEVSGQEAAAIELGKAFGQLAAQAVDNSFKCAEKAGCHKGYCFTYCGLSLSGGDWCYTTRGRSQDFNYIRCSRDDECDPCWKCAGSCTL